MLARSLEQKQTIGSDATPFQNKKSVLLPKGLMILAPFDLRTLPKDQCF